MCSAHERAGSSPGEYAKWQEPHSFTYVGSVAARNPFLLSGDCLWNRSSAACEAVTAQAPASGRHPTDVVIFLYNRMTALDAIGPYEVLRCVLVCACASWRRPLVS